MSGLGRAAVAGGSQGDGGRSRLVGWEAGAEGPPLDRSLVQRIASDISRLSPRIDRIFFGKHLIHFMVLKMKDFRNFVLDNCILDFDAEQVYLEPQVTNLKNKEVTANPKPQTLKKSWFFENPKP